MTDEPVLYNERVDELTRLIDAHLERGALDEGNATAFDGIIDAWLAEEIARLDNALRASADAAKAAAAAAEADAAAAERERLHRRERELEADARRWAGAESAMHARQRVSEAQMQRHKTRIRAAEDRVEAARLELDRARELLLGTGPVEELVAAHGSAGETDATGFDDTQRVA